MVDIHCHILPKIDDGADSWETSQAMCEMARRDGIDHIVATPHSNDEYTYDRALSLELLASLRERAGDGMAFSLGCDFHLSYENIRNATAEPGRFSIGDTHYLLVEFSHYVMGAQNASLIRDVQAAGLTPIITHPERFPLLQHRLDQVVELVRRGCLVQITAGSLTGRFGERARRASEWLVAHDAVHVLASDAHDICDRVPILSEAREVVGRFVGPDVADALVEANPRAIVADQLPPYSPEPRRSKSFWSRLVGR